MWHQLLHFAGWVLAIGAGLGVIALRISSYQIYRDSDTRFQTIFGKDRWWQ
jgi:hypothetical protein